MSLSFQSPSPAEAASPHLWSLSPQQRPLEAEPTLAQVSVPPGLKQVSRMEQPASSEVPSQPKWDGSVETHPSPGAPRGELPAVVVTHSLTRFLLSHSPHPLTYFLDWPPSKLPALKSPSQSLLWGHLRLRPPPPRLGPGAVRSPTSVWKQAFSE